MNHEVWDIYLEKISVPLSETCDIARAYLSVRLSLYMEFRDSYTHEHMQVKAVPEALFAIMDALKSKHGSYLTDILSIKFVNVDNDYIRLISSYIMVLHLHLIFENRHTTSTQIMHPL